MTLATACLVATIMAGDCSVDESKSPRGHSACDTDLFLSCYQGDRVCFEGWCLGESNCQRVTMP